MAGIETTKLLQWNHLADDISAAVQGFLNFGRVRNLSPQSIDYYRYRLLAFQRFLDRNAPGTTPKDVTSRLVREFIGEESQQKSPSTANHSVITLRAFFNFLVRDGFLDRNPLSGVQKVQQRKRIIETFAMDQIEAVLTTCDRDFKGVRDRAIILTLLDCGLRVSELCGLRLVDISWNNQLLCILGKGDKERLVPFGSCVRQTLVHYLARRGELPVDSVFVTTLGDPLDRYRLRDMIESRCRKAGITGVRCSPHTLRHTFAITYLRAGGDVFSLQKLLGHSDLAMTRRYCELAQSDITEKHRLYLPADRLNGGRSARGRKRLK